jgi:hypothetical protein
MNERGKVERHGISNNLEVFKLGNYSIRIIDGFAQIQPRGHGHVHNGQGLNGCRQPIWQSQKTRQPSIPTLVSDHALHELLAMIVEVAGFHSPSCDLDIEDALHKGQHLGLHVSLRLTKIYACTPIQLNHFLVLELENFQLLFLQALATAVY